MTVVERSAIEWKTLTGIAAVVAALPIIAGFINGLLDSSIPGYEPAVLGIVFLLFGLPVFLTLGGFWFYKARGAPNPYKKWLYGSSFVCFAYALVVLRYCVSGWH